jgi:hypothetical protein
MRTTSQNTQTTKTVSQGESRYGTAEPQIEIRLPKGTSHRLVSAALHKLAADVELATPERERWIVQTESFYDARGLVYLELAERTLRAVAHAGTWAEQRAAWATLSPAPRRSDRMPRTGRVGSHLRTAP